MSFNFKSYEDSLKNNIEQCDKNINEFKRQLDRYNIVANFLKTSHESLSYQAMVPLGNVAYMPGKITNTNEVLIYIGADYFAKMTNTQALEVISLRLSRIESKIQDTLKNKEAFEQKLIMKDKILSMLGFDKNIVEIKEDFNPEMENLWREKHKANLSSFYQEQAKKRKHEVVKSKHMEFEEQTMLEKLDSMELEDKIDTLINNSLNNYNLSYSKDTTQISHTPNNTVRVTQESIAHASNDSTSPKSNQNDTPKLKFENKRVRWNHVLEQSLIDQKEEEDELINDSAQNRSNSTNMDVNIPKLASPPVLEQESGLDPKLTHNLKPKSILKVKQNPRHNAVESSPAEPVAQDLLIDHSRLDRLKITDDGGPEIKRVDILGDVRERTLPSARNEEFVVENDPSTLPLSGKMSQFKKEKLERRKKMKYQKIPNQNLVSDP